MNYIVDMKDSESRIIKKFCHEKCKNKFIECDRCQDFSELKVYEVLRQ